MKQREIFELIVRVFGLYLVLMALKQLYLAALELILPSSASVITMLVWGIPALVIGIWFLKGAKKLVAWAFCEKSAEGSGPL